MGFFVLFLLMACTPPESPPEPVPENLQQAIDAISLDPPAGPEAMAPNLAVSGATGEILLSWLEPVNPGEGEGFRLLFSRLAATAWTAPVEIVAGDDFFANWADLPGVVEGGDGTLYAHWLAKLGQGAYAYGVRLARSGDGGEHWGGLGWLHDDASPAEHGFVAYAPMDTGVRAFWLDGRGMLPVPGSHHGAGPMQLRTAILQGGGKVGAPASDLVDDRVCECCATDAAVTPGGPVVAYRDRSEGEVRDIALRRWLGEGWSEPTRVHRDDWHIPGCPVNGPAVAAAGSRVAVAWFTAAAERPRVQLAFSADGGATFGEPILIDDAAPLGRVDLVLDGEGVWVGWLAASGDVLLRRVALQGASEAPLIVGHAGTRRAAGVPRLVRSADRLVVAWVQDGGEEADAPRLRTVILSAP
jgi:hypothetical protein